MIKKLSRIVYGDIKGYIATTQVDKLGQKFTREELEEFCRTIPEKPFIYYEHDLSKPPVAKIINQRIVQIEDYYAIEVEAEVFEQKILEMIKEGKLRSFSIEVCRV